MQSPNSSIRYLFSLLGSIRKESFGLHRMQRLMAELANPERDDGIVHVAGTNGKGSTAAMIESGLRTAGRTTGLYTSPHLSRINERFLIKGRPVSDEQLAMAIEPVRMANERIASRDGRGWHPTFFESATAVALVLFRQCGVEFRIVETGLGGRLDASNVVRPRLVVFTRIDHDHERYLGRGLDRIAAEKGAIVKPGCPVVMARQRLEARAVLLQCCQRAGVEIHDSEAEWDVRDSSSSRGCWRFTLANGSRSIRIELGLAGEHQVDNALTAVTALDALGIPAASIAEGLRCAAWPGRLEIARENPTILLDSAHNPGGARALARFLCREARKQQVTLVFGASRDKAIDEIAGWIFPVADRVLLTRSKVGRSANPRALRDVVGHHHPRVEIASGVEQALDAARADCDPKGWIVVAGSIFLVGEARDLLG